MQQFDFLYSASSNLADKSRNWSIVMLQYDLLLYYVILETEFL